MSSITSNFDHKSKELKMLDHKSKELKMHSSDNNFKNSEDEVHSSESSTDDDEEDAMHISDGDYIPDTSDSDNSSVASSSNEDYLKAETNFQSSASHSDAEQNPTAKTLKIGVTPELMNGNLKNNTKQSEIFNHKEVDNITIDQNVENIGLLSQSKNIDISPQNNQLSLQENLNLRKSFAVSQILQNSSQGPLQMNKVDDTLKARSANETVFKNCDQNPNAFSTEIQKKVKKRMQLKLKDKFMNIIRKDNENIKLSMLRELKDMDRKDFLNCLMHLELIPSYYKCPKCGKNMLLVWRGEDTSDKYSWVCRKEVNGLLDHYVKRSVRMGSVFYNKVLCLEKILILFHCWVYKMPFEWMYLELGHSKDTIMSYLKVCRIICTEICAKDDTKLGGDGKVVEISGKVFENCTMRTTLEFKWIFFGIEDACSDKYFFRIFDKCDQQSFLETVKSAVLPGTTIVSEFSSVYSDSIKDLDGLYTFKSLADASLKDSLWKDVTEQLPRHRKINNNFDCHIGEFAWRRKNSHVHDKMKKFLSDIKIAFPLQTTDID